MSNATLVIATSQVFTVATTIYKVVVVAAADAAEVTIRDNANVLLVPLADGQKAAHLKAALGTSVNFDWHCGLSLHSGCHVTINSGTGVEVWIYTR